MTIGKRADKCNCFGGFCLRQYCPAKRRRGGERNGREQQNESTRTVTRHDEGGQKERTGTSDE